MKKLSLVLALVLVLSCAAMSVSAATIQVKIDGKDLVPKDANGNIIAPIKEGGTTYLPLRSVANAFGLSVDWDDATQTVFLDGAIGSPTLGDQINIYIAGQPFTATDANGTVVYPKLVNDTTYLPVRAIAQAFNKVVAWDEATSTVTIETKVEYTIAPNGTAPAAGRFYIRNTASGAYLTLTAQTAGSKLTTTETADANAVWSLEANGNYFQMIHEASTLAADVNAASTAPGGELIVWNKSGDDNQQFSFTANADGAYSIAAKHSSLPMEVASGEILQTEKQPLANQYWILEAVQ